MSNLIKVSFVTAMSNLRYHNRMPYCCKTIQFSMYNVVYNVTDLVRIFFYFRKYMYIIKYQHFNIILSYLK